MDWTEITNLLARSGQPILGVVLGAAVVVFGQVVNASSTRNASKRSLEASRESTAASVTIAETAARMQMKSALLSATLDAYEAFHLQMVEWEISVRDDLTLGHREVPERHAYAGWIISEEWKAALLLGRLKAVTSGSLPKHAESVQRSGLNALRAHEHNFSTGLENDQEARHGSEQRKDHGFGGLQKEAGRLTRTPARNVSD
ncbi:hypothetical protein [Rhodoglobus aureus]|uniref:Uncharacterized protein n=1 Tax=Rhodoglobus aureus TaxID=191497 RepID=A0ABN1VUX0_9MICO